MPGYIADFSDAVVFDNTPIPDGVYKAVIDASKAGQLKPDKKGNNFFTLGFVIQEGEQAGRIAWINFWLAGTQSGRLKTLLKTFGIYTDDMGNKFKFDPNVLHGLECEVRLKVRDNYNELVSVKAL